MQYRYGRNIVEPEAQDKLKAAKASETVAFCFVHLDDFSKTAQLVPLRLGKLLSAEAVGSSFVLTVELGEFIEPKPAVDSYQHLQERHKNIIPRFDHSSGEAKIAGNYVFFCEDGFFGDANPGIIDGFEGAVNRLAKFPLFKQKDKEHNPCSLFFHIIGLRTVLDGLPKFLNWLELLWWSPPPSFQSHAPYSVMSWGRYELQLYHFSPESERSDETSLKAINVSCPSELIEFVSDQRVAVDSEYDVKRVTFDVQNSSTSHQTVIDLAVLSPDREGGSLQGECKRSSPKQLFACEIADSRHCAWCFTSKYHCIDEFRQGLQ